MPNPSRRKGDRNEYYLRDLHRELGIDCTRHPYSGGLGGILAGDLTIEIPGMAMVGEVKARKQAPKTLVRWLRENDALFIRPDGEPPLVILPWRTWVRLLRAIQEAQVQAPNA
jgi:hypothetical protein